MKNNWNLNKIWRLLVISTDSTVAKCSISCKAIHFTRGVSCGTVHPRRNRKKGENDKRKREKETRRFKIRKQRVPWEQMGIELQGRSFFWEFPDKIVCASIFLIDCNFINYRIIAYLSAQIVKIKLRQLVFKCWKKTICFHCDLFHLIGEFSQFEKCHLF